MARSNSKSKKSGGSLRVKFIGVSLVPMVILAILIGLVVQGNLRDGLRQEIMNSLQAEARTVGAAYNAIDEGSFSKNGAGELLKGSYNITQNMDVIDSFVDGTDMEVSLFYGSDRVATTLKDEKTGERLLDTPVDDGIVSAVVQNGGNISRYDISIGDRDFYGYYMPLKDSSGTIVGMTFAGEDCAKVNSYIRQKVMTVIVVETIIIVIAAALILIALNGILKGVAAAEKTVMDLSNGNLETEIELKAARRNDELGDMVKGVAVLLNQLKDAVVNIKQSSKVLLSSGTQLSDMASQSSETANEVSKAIEGISKGAISQAEEIETASKEIERMGELIQTIVHNVDDLNDGAARVQQASENSMAIVKELSDSNDQSREAVKKVAVQVNATNESAQKIRAAVDLITSIAEETNLLSLNASIEAARAGEQGRGFAVVAGQIQKLAEQSNESAKTIADIIQALLRDSESMVEVMDEVNEIMDVQQQKLDETKEQFKVVEKGINGANDAASTIKQQTDTCDEARAKIEDVISNLSALSEENAAATEETTASMQELNATMNLLAESAESLQQLSGTLEENVSFFRVREGGVLQQIKEDVKTAAEREAEEEWQK